MTVDQEIRIFIRENFLYGNEELVPGDDESFLQKGLIDSTGVLEVVGFIEEKFGIKVEDEELVPENLDSINRLKNYVMRKTGAKV